MCIAPFFSSARFGQFLIQSINTRSSARARALCGVRCGYNTFDTCACALTGGVPDEADRHTGLRSLLMLLATHEEAVDFVAVAVELLFLLVRTKELRGDLVSGLGRLKGYVTLGNDLCGSAGDDDPHHTTCLLHLLLAVVTAAATHRTESVLTTFAEADEIIVRVADICSRDEPWQVAGPAHVILGALIGYPNARALLAAYKVST